MANVLILVASFEVRRALKQMLSEAAIENCEISAILTFFFSLFYLNYKINEILEKHQPGESPGNFIA